MSEVLPITEATEDAGTTEDAGRWLFEVESVTRTRVVLSAVRPDGTPLTYESAWGTLTPSLSAPPSGMLARVRVGDRFRLVPADAHDVRGEETTEGGNG